MPQFTLFDETNRSLSLPARQALAWLQTQETPIWLVGGTVRDLLLGRPAHDLDLVTPGSGLRLARRLADALGAAYFALDAERDVGRAVLLESDGSQTFVDVACSRAPTLEDDLRLRDFTINALALDLHAAAQVIDVTGGLDDLQARRLRVASDRAFRDDPLRILRGVRMAQTFGLTWDAATIALARAEAANLNQVAAERMREELVRTFMHNAAAAVRQLDALDALQRVLPELKALQGVTQNPPHRLDVYEHTLAVAGWMQQILAWLHGAPEAAPELAPLTADLAHVRPALAAHLAQTVEQGYSRAALLVWSALLHDIGKPTTRRVDAADAISFEEHEAISGRLAAALCRRLTFGRVAGQLIARTCTEHRRAGALSAATAGRPDRRDVYRFFRGAHPVGVETALLSLADHLGAQANILRPQRWQMRCTTVQTLLTAFVLHYAEQVEPPLLLDGRQLLERLGLAPGPQIGALLGRLREEQAAGVIVSPDDAWAFMQAQIERTARNNRS